MKNYVYKDKKTGKKVYSDVPIKNERLVLVTAVRNGQIKQHETNQT